MLGLGPRYCYFVRIVHFFLLTCAGKTCCCPAQYPAFLLESHGASTYGQHFPLANDLTAVGIRTTMRPVERAPDQAAHREKTHKTLALQWRIEIGMIQRYVSLAQEWTRHHGVLEHMGNGGTYMRQ
jgi:hypothetical protein